MTGYTLKVPQIKPLLRDMVANNAKQAQFRFEYNHVGFDVIVLIDREPYELLFGAVNHNLAFTLHMHKGYILDSLPNDVYYALLKILNLKGGSEHFNSMIFLRFFAEHIPRTFSGRKVQPHEVAVLKNRDMTRSETVDESDKIYFKGWKNHFTDGRQVRNLEKTRELLGYDAYIFCRDHNISSCWSANPSERVDYYLPRERMSAST